jgi:hypothetical protein
MITVEQATVYRGGGRRWFTKRAAVKAYAAAKFRTKHPCKCENPDYGSGYPGYVCHVHELRECVLPRYVRVLWRQAQKREQAA